MKAAIVLLLIYIWSFFLIFPGLVKQSFAYLPAWKEVDFFPDDKINTLDFTKGPDYRRKDVLIYYATVCKQEGQSCSNSYDCCGMTVCNGKCTAVTEADKYFTITVADENFCLYANNANAVKGATDNYLDYKNGRPVTTHPQGLILPGNGGFNYGYGGEPGDKYWRWWSWHLDPDTVNMAEYSIELCDGLPSAVESNLVGSSNYCPWTGKVTQIGCYSP